MERHIMTSGHKAIGVLAPQLSGDYFGTLLMGIHAVTRRHDPRLIAVQASPQDLVRTQLALDQVDGWIVVNDADGADLLAKTGVPIVTIGAQAPGLDRPAVFPDNFAGMRAAVSHLADHGHRRIAFIGNLGHNDIKQRYAGYQAALADHGIPGDPALVFAVADNSEQSGAQAIRHLLGIEQPCTAVAVATDENALGVLSEAQSAGYRVPEDLAVVGFDDIILAHSATPPLTTVRLPLRALGGAAAELLLAQIAGQAVPGGENYVATALIPRRSCGCGVTTPAPAAPDESGDRGWREALAQQLAELARYPLPADPAIPLGAIWPGGETLVDALAAAFDNTGEVGAAELHQAWRQFVALTENLEVLLAILAALESAAARQLDVSADRGAPSRLQSLFEQIRMEMLRARLAPETNAIRSYSSLVQQNYQISRTLLTAEIGEAQRLAWLGQTPLSCACLGLWDGADKGARPSLVIAGSYSRDVQSQPHAPLGKRYAARLFPPAELLPPSVREEGSEIAILLPIRSASRNWGILALAGSTQYLHSSGNYDILSAIATQLGAAMERDTLQQTLYEAYARERGLATIVREIGSPVIPLLPGVLLIPLIGAIDSARAQQIIEAVLQGVAGNHATTVLLDISGVPIVDTQVANSLIQAARAASLLGARMVLIGIRPEIAQSIVGLGVDLSQIATQPTLAAAVRLLLKERA
jgi:DNA-binding LacI/PurR family transcriptional regulator/anti-anti-sigma regulatory factor